MFQAEVGIRLSPQPKLALEMLFIKLAQLKPVVSFDEIIKKLGHLAKEIKTGQPKTLPAPNHTTESEQDSASSENLAQNWQQLLAVLSDGCPALVPNLEKATLTKIGKDFLEITVAGNSFYTARLRDKRSMASLQKVCDQFFKRKMKINIVESRKETSQESQRKESDRARHLKREALSHPLVTDALEVFQGRVVDVKIL
jgi:DNA polymerase-3 subunit gamma/tau